MSRDPESGKKPTIAHIMPWVGIGGVEIAVLRMVNAMRNEFRHVAFCLHEAPVLRSSFAALGVETVAYTPPEPSLRHGGRFYRESRELARRIRATGADIVHFAETKAAEHMSLAALLAGSRTLCHVRNTYPNMDRRQKILMLPVHEYIFVSKEARRQFGVEVPDRKTHVLYDAIEIPAIDIAAANVDVRREFAIPTDCTVVGMVARVNPQKDYSTLASAAEEVLRRHPDTRFMIVGDNAQVALNRQHYQELMATLNNKGIAHSFVFTGHRDDVPRLIAAMDISVLSTHREGFGLCIAESMAMGKPVVATAVGGLLEVVQDKETGLLHEHGNGPQLAEGILSLIENPENARRMGLAGREHVRRDYSEEQFVKELSGIYRDVMR